MTKVIEYQRPPSSRRDLRYALQPGSSSIDLGSNPGGRAELTTISAAGLAFELEAAVESYPVGRLLEDVTVRIGSCTVRGDAVVRDAKAVEGARCSVGCLFHPQPGEPEHLWMAVVSGLEAAPGRDG